MNPSTSQCDGGVLPSANLSSKIEVVQEILARLENVLKIVTRRKDELLYRRKTKYPNENTITAEYSEAFRRAFGQAQSIIKLIGEALNQYCAFDNILRTVEEHQRFQETVILFPDLSRLDTVMAFFQKDKVSEWNLLRQKIDQFNSEPRKEGSENGIPVPVVSRLLQVRWAPLASQNTGLQSGQTSSSHYSTGKRPLSGEPISYPPEKIVRMSCNKSDAVAAAAITGDPLRLVRNLYSQTDQQILEIVDLGVTEDERLVTSAIPITSVKTVQETVNGSNSTQTIPSINAEQVGLNAHVYPTEINYNENINSNPFFPSQPQNSNVANQRDVYSVPNNNQCFSSGANNTCRYDINSNATSASIPISYNGSQSQNLYSKINQVIPVPTYSNNVNTHYPHSSGNSNFNTVNKQTNFSTGNYPNSIHSNQFPSASTPQISNNSSIYYNSALQTQLQNSSYLKEEFKAPPPYQTPALTSQISNNSNIYYNSALHTQLQNSGCVQEEYKGPPPYQTLQNSQNQLNTLNSKAPSLETCRDVTQSSNTIIAQTYMLASTNTNQFATTSSNPNEYQEYQHNNSSPIINSLLTYNNNPSGAEESTSNYVNTNVFRPSVIQKSPSRVTSLNYVNQTNSSYKPMFNEIQNALEFVESLPDISSTENVAEEPINPVPTDPVIVEDSFEKLNLKKCLLDGIKSWGLSKPKPFQMQVIDTLVKERKDMVLRDANSGGKTTLAIVAALQTVDESRKAAQAIILSQSTMDSLQIQARIMSIHTHTKISSICVDDTVVNNTDANSENTCQVIVGMPANVLLFLQKHNFRTEMLKTLLIDSADRLLKNGWISDIMKIIYALSGDTQVAMMVKEKSDAVIAFAKRFLRSPKEIESPEIEVVDVPDDSDTVESPTSIDAVVAEVNDASQSSPISTSELNSPSNPSALQSSEFINVNPKFIFKVKRADKQFAVVEVTAELPNGEEMELELEKDPLAELSPCEEESEDPLALSEHDNGSSGESMASPGEVAKRLKSQDLLLQNPTLNIVFPEDFTKTFTTTLPNDKIVNISEEQKMKKLSSIPHNVACKSETEKTGSSVVVERTEFLSKKHFYISTDEDDIKIESLALFDIESERAIIFCNTLEKVEWLRSKLRQKSLFPQVVHKFTNAKDKSTILKTFEMGVCRVLITTDKVLTDIQGCGVPLVINYDLPAIPVNYFWRSRFAARNALSPSQKSLMVVSFIKENDLPLIYHIEKTYGVKISSMMEEGSSSRGSSEAGCSVDELDLEHPD